MEGGWLMGVEERMEERENQMWEQGWGWRRGEDRRWKGVGGLVEEVGEGRAKSRWRKTIPHKKEEKEEDKKEKEEDKEEKEEDKEEKEEEEEEKEDKEEKEEDKEEKEEEEEEKEKEEEEKEEEE
ncbi:hypothetical protein Pmani_032806 [Petrolisthes manimaculis]|uniref:Uncharacterized protein n=1 Tax=Petrolisthes manimaculis TaxID=1843537 RepID=A0AAE1TTE1_9EUCA|nr:hypothetical protein Pmani_032806 [Petrolisthes manimaculis]